MNSREGSKSRWPTLFPAASLCPATVRALASRKQRDAANVFGFHEQSHLGTTPQFGREHLLRALFSPNLPVSESRSPGVRPFLLTGQKAVLAWQGLG